jgi:hypothetical protein
LDRKAVGGFLQTNFRIEPQSLPQKAQGAPFESFRRPQVRSLEDAFCHTTVTQYALPLKNRRHGLRVGKQKEREQSIRALGWAVSKLTGYVSHEQTDKTR